MSEITTIWNPIVETPDCSEPFAYQYPETVELDRHMFRHVHGGVYIAEKEFRVLPKDLWALSRKYPDVEFIMRREEDDTAVGRPVRTVLFARSCTHARHDLHSFETFIRDTQQTDSREKIILEDMFHLEDYCHDSYKGDEDFAVYRCFGDDTDDHFDTVDGESIRGKLSYALPDKNNTYQGYRKHIVIDGLIGYLILPGIYYFGYTKQDMEECKTDKERDLKAMLRAVPCVDMNGRVREKTAVICYSTGDYHPSPYILIEYLAVGEENINVLKQIVRTKKTRGWGCAVFWEFHIADPDEDDADGPQAFDVEQWLLKEKEKAPVPLQPYFVEEGAEELLPGIGIKDIRVGLKYIFCPSVEVRQYEYAYKAGEKLVLVERDEDGRAVRQEYDLCMLEELVVRRTVQMNCGVMMERDCLLIDCREEKEKQVLKPEAYELFSGCREMEE